MQQQSVSPNDILRFILEMAALGALIWWGFAAAEAWPARVLLGVGVPVGLAAAWGTFRVPNDPKPDPPVEVAGPVRLLLEVVFFASAVAATVIAGGAALGGVFAAILVAHYAIAYRRVVHLLRNEPV